MVDIYMHFNTSLEKMSVEDKLQAIEIILSQGTTS